MTKDKIMEINSLERMEQLLRRAYETDGKAKRAVFVHGPPGVGKSESIKELADDLKIGFIDKRLAQMDPTDLAGIPFRDGNKTKNTVPDWLPTEGKGLLVLDEFNTSPLSVQHAALQLIWDRKLGDYVLPAGWMIVAIGNRAQDRAGVYEMSAPLRNRFIHVDVDVPSVSDWTEWAIAHDVDSRCVSYLNFKGSNLYTFKPDEKTTVFATPRSWAMCSELIKGVDSLQEVKLYSGATVGEGVAIEFTSFIKLAQDIDVDALLDAPDKAKIPDGVDVKWSLIGAIAERVKENKKKFDNACKLALRFEPEFALILARTLLQQSSVNVTSAANSKAFTSLVDKYGKFIGAR